MSKQTQHRQIHKHQQNSTENKIALHDGPPATQVRQCKNLMKTDFANKQLQMSKKCVLNESQNTNNKQHNSIENICFGAILQNHLKRKKKTNL